MYRLTIHLSNFPSQTTCSFKIAFAAPVFSYPAERVVVLHLLPGGAASSPNVTFCTTSALACQKCYIFPMNFKYYNSSFSKCSSRPHFSYIFCLASTCYENSDPPRLNNISQNQFVFIFRSFFHCFYVSATRLQFCEVTKKVHALLGHDALEGVHVHEMTLCVTFGAPPFGERFRRFTRCFKYVVFHMVSGTHVRRTTLCVTFCARGRSILLGLLDRFLGHLDYQDGPGTPERPHLVPVGPRPRPRMTSEPHFDTPATTSRPPGGYLP